MSNPYETKKRERIEAMFDKIAPRYDILNRVLSMGIDRQWRRRAVRGLREAAPANVLDVATGTADMAIRIARSMPAARVIGIDLSEGMLVQGRHKVERAGLTGRVELRQADVADMPFADGQFDAVTVAFGVRNFEDTEKGIAQMRRVLKPGGQLVILEFSMPRGRFFRWLYSNYFRRVVPQVGGMVSGDRDAYTYLPSSVERFATPGELMDVMRGAGFGDCRARALTGGIAYLYTAKAE